MRQPFITETYQCVFFQLKHMVIPLFFTFINQQVRAHKIYTVFSTLSLSNSTEHAQLAPQWGRNLFGHTWRIWNNAIASCNVSLLLRFAKFAGCVAARKWYHLHGLDEGERASELLQPSAVVDKQIEGTEWKRYVLGKHDWIDMIAWNQRGGGRKEISPPDPLSESQLLPSFCLERV